MLNHKSAGLLTGWRKITRRAGGLFLVALLVGVFALPLALRPSPARAAETIRVAAAADLKFAMAELATQYQAKSGQNLDVTYGSSGNFFSQMQNGAPFDLFFSADIDYPRKLESLGFAEPGTLYLYAVGRIVLWAPPDSKVDVTHGWDVLRDPTVQKISVANPEHAPYGRAAVAALRAAGIYNQVSSKLIYGENISQAAQFVQSGNAQVGVIALALAISPAMKDGHRWEIPANSYPPIEQGVIVLKASKNKPVAISFLDFVKSDSGRATLEKFGFSIGPAASKASQ
jgi:molybdate transport system substrate-binding protein